MTRILHRQQPLTRLLRANPIFRPLDEDILPQLVDVALCRHFQAKSVIIQQGEPSPGLYLIASGMVKVSRYSRKGREHILAILHQGDSFNEVAALDGGASPATAIAYTKTEVWCLAHDSLLQVAHQYPTVAIALATSVSSRARQLVDKLDDLSMCSVTGRLARFLLRGADDHDRIRNLLTQEEIASYLGTVREMVGRTLRKLELDGVIQSQPETIQILDRDRLTVYADL